MCKDPRCNLHYHTNDNNIFVPRQINNVSNNFNWALFLALANRNDGYGPPGPTGPVGPQGPIGPPGPSGNIISYAFFYGNAPADYPNAINSGIALDFPHAGPNNGSDITRSSPGQFILNNKGTYEIFYQATILGGAQLMLRVNGIIQSQTLASSRASGQVINDVIITTTNINSVLEVINPNPIPFTLMPFNEGIMHAPSETLVIKQLS